jgi:hypothetical protein
MPDETITKQVSERYAKAVTTGEQMCCPTGYNFDDLRSFVPEEVLRVSYGCGTPAGLAGGASATASVNVAKPATKTVRCFISLPSLSQDSRPRLRIALPVLYSIRSVRPAGHMRRDLFSHELRGRIVRRVLPAMPGVL